MLTEVYSERQEEDQAREVLGKSEQNQVRRKEWADDRQALPHRAFCQLAWREHTLEQIKIADFSTKLKLPAGFWPDCKICF